MDERIPKPSSLSCGEFACALAARTSTPGGGGAAALAGALGVALCSMAARFSAGKPSRAEVEDDIQRVIDEAEAIRAKLVGLIDADADAFAAFSQAYAFPKDDPLRGQLIEAAATQAAFVPIETMRTVARSVELLEEMETYSTRLLISDVGCGAALASAALTAASLNVFVNTNMMSDAEHASDINDECDRLLDTYVPRADTLARRVGARIRGRA